MRMETTSRSGAGAGRSRGRVDAAVVGSVALAVAAAWAVDLVRVLDGSAPRGAPGGWEYLSLFSGAVMAVLVLGVLPPRTPPRRTGLIGVAVLLITQAASLAYGFAPKSGAGYPDGLAEIAAMTVVVGLVAYRCPPSVVTAVAVLALTAPLLSGILRTGRPADVDATLVLLLLLVPGLSLRWLRERRQWQIERARQEERDALARDLHDVVAHHVTGIVVQAQALRYVRHPELVGSALSDIEQAGVGALDAMQRLVDALRRGGPGLARLSDTAGVLNGMRRPGGGGRPEVETRIEGDPRSLPPEVASAVVRMAQEALTNTERHAHGADRVTVLLRVGADRVRLDVRDNGRGGTGFGGGGYGLVGMAERAGLLGGAFRAGPVPDGPGWRVSVDLPIGRPAGGPA